MVQLIKPLMEKRRSQLVIFSGNVSYESSSGRVKLSTDPVKKISNAIMELEPAKMSDRGIVSCIAHNYATTIQDPMEATIYVRVKGKANIIKSCAPRGESTGTPAG